MTYMYTVPVNVYIGVVFFHIKRFAKMGRKCNLFLNCVAHFFFANKQNFNVNNAEYNFC